MKPASQMIRLLAVCSGLLLATSAHAHAGHGTHSLLEGLAHPLGLDHLLAMVAVGLWSLSALPRNKVWWGPVTFLTVMVAAAYAGTVGLTMPYLEHSIALSVVLMGAMLVFARQQRPTTWGLTVVAATAALHGLAHGAETPEAGFTAYALGFVVSTTALHLGGLAVGLLIQRKLWAHAGMAWGGLGALFGAAGIYLFGQLA